MFLPVVGPQGYLLLVAGKVRFEAFAWRTLKNIPYLVGAGAELQTV